MEAGVEVDNETQRKEPLKRCGHCTAYFGNCMFLWGGYSSVQTNSLHQTSGDIYLPPQEMWVYNVETDQWMRYCVGDHEVHPPGTSGACAEIVNGAVYVIFGFQYTSLLFDSGQVNETWRLDVSNKKWSKVRYKEGTRHPSPRDKFVSWLYQNKIYCFGGYGTTPADCLNDNGEYFTDVDQSNEFLHKAWNNQLLVFDPDESEWTNPKTFGDVPSPRAAHAADILKDKVYLFGGRHAAHRLADLYVFDVKYLCWTIINAEGQCPVGRSWHSFSALEPNYMLLYGGYSTDNQLLGDCWMFDVTSMQWTEVTSPCERPRLWHSACVSSHNEVLIFGGCCSDILNNTLDNEHTNELAIFRISPKSLKRFCLDAVFKYRKHLKNQWDILPKTLSMVLHAKLQGAYNSSPSRHKTCSLT